MKEVIINSLLTSDFVCGDSLVSEGPGRLEDIRVL